MERLTRFCRALARHPLALDLAVALVILLINLVVPGGRHVGERIQLNQTVVLLAIAGAVVITFRRRAPLLVLAITTMITTTFVIAEQGKSPIVIYMGVAAYTVVLSKDRPTRSIAVVATALVSLTAEALFVGGDVLDNLGLTFFVLFSGAIGEAVRYRRAYLLELEERAVRAEQSRDEEAQRRVIEERLRIAHELHDVIAHHIALMNVQSGVAAHILRTQPDEAERALSLVRSGGRTVLQELTVLLGVLRRSGSPLPTAPTPSLHELDALIRSFTAAGVEVDWTPPASLGALPDVIELTAYRIVQESLTNVLKHAPGAAAEVQLIHRSSALEITVTNGPAPASTSEARGGHGLVGMRERVSAVGGELRAGPAAGGGFAVHAVLPLETGDLGDDQSAAGRRSDVDPERVPGAGEFSTRSGGRC
ncbi:signal transduction histidine kinase [Kribbella sp. VKM Ac-2571]|uniref:sensor histidine kinase n=1 Tax=Kribbella sp. VKM Ac-2571 TaxID=2512222 RepID=UPI00105E47DA|nr:histidine kinase [Kribbella sp. VKM Ac-2571]TDO66611.1 signal transduction histidine kinase [Kribbella sp. VKM Ac-2571]